MKMNLEILNTGLGQPWKIIDGKLTKTFVFPDFAAAFAFMTHVALVAEKMDHHPDWSNSYNKVIVELVTHSKGEITDLDYSLARQIEVV